jgi:phytoene dehydrogenase-like protein
MSCFVQYCPPKVEGRNWTDADRDGFAETVISQIADYSPGFRDRIVHMEVRTPRELEAEVGLTEGNIFQGELTFDQLLFNRPVPATPNTARRSAASICAARPPIRAAASWALPAATPRPKSCATSPSA